VSGVLNCLGSVNLLPREANKRLPVR
jgi:hypothetical protein